MFRKICNHLAIMSLTLIIAGQAIIAKPLTQNMEDTVSVDTAKTSNFYKRILPGGRKHLYTVKVENGKKAKIIISATNKVGVKIYANGQETTSQSQEKDFTVNLGTPGEYTVEIESFFVSLYTMEVLFR